MDSYEVVESMGVLTRKGFMHLSLLLLGVSALPQHLL